jgi:hemoglobin
MRQMKPTDLKPSDRAGDHDELVVRAGLDARRSAAEALQRERTGITDAMIARVVHTFYGKIRADAVLGPVFAAHITDWPPHLAKMCAFWSSVTLASGLYHGRPMPAHAPLAVSAAHFDRWLGLFEAAADEVCPPTAAGEFKTKARMIARSLEGGIAVYRGVLLAPGDRLPPPEQAPA